MLKCVSRLLSAGTESTPSRNCPSLLRLHFPELLKSPNFPKVKIPNLMISLNKL